MVSWIVTDNIVYVYVAGDRMRMHQVPALIGFLGGLAVFGAAGMILGPAILAATAAVLEVWHARAIASEEPAPVPASGPAIHAATEPVGGEAVAPPVRLEGAT